MNLYSFHKCSYLEIDKLVSFLDTHWGENHSLVLSRELMNFQHYNAKEETYNFILAENNQTLEIDAVIGFISTSQYDINLESNGDYWGAIWKKREDIKNEEDNSVGFYIWEQLFNLPYFNSLGAIGLNDMAKKFYKKSRFKLGTLDHYYLLNTQKKKFYIAKNIKSEFKDSFCLNENYKIDYISISDVNAPPIVTYRPAKSIAYFIQRYAKHPIYKYKFLGVFHNKNLISIWAVRLITARNSKTLRIIDILGDIEELPNLQNQVQKILISDNAEYIDILNFGIDEKIFLSIGFQKLDLNGNIIIPTYFEPFERRNVMIDFAYKADFNYKIFKGDADQDRPSIIEKV